MSADSAKAWHQRAAQLEIRSQAFIGGRYVDALSGRTAEDVNPATGRTLANVTCCDMEDADRAIQAARRSFDSGAWSRMAPMARKKVLVRLAELMEKHHEELALLETLDVGKPISDSLNIDVPSSITTIRWNGEAIDKLYDEIAPTPHDVLGLVTRMPLGVVVAIVPWNFPLGTTCWKLGPALATGNSVILKPASATPLTALRLAGLAAEAGLPDGVLNVLPGPGGQLGKYLATHMDVDCLTFTGSTEVGKQLTIYSGESNLKRTFLELGGKSPNIVFADADLGKAAEGAALAIYYNMGEACTAGSRLLVESSIAEKFTKMIAQASGKYQPGDPLDPETLNGSLVDRRQLETVQSYVESGQREGAHLVCGGRRVLEASGGYFYEPTIFDQVNNGMRIAREEIFGPVLSVITFDTLEEALQIANDTNYGLAAGVWTSDLNKAHICARELRAGSVWVNNYFGGDITVPFGGFKESGNGRDKSLHAMDKYTELKATWIELTS